MSEEAICGQGRDQEDQEQANSKVAPAPLLDRPTPVMESAFAPWETPKPARFFSASPAVDLRQMPCVKNLPSIDALLVTATLQLKTDFTYSSE